ncbi:MAG: hypothetical protein R2847_05970 [Bacteroidia bacterium]
MENHICKYDNHNTAIFGDTGILSYVNHITNKNVNTGAIEYEHISWVDIYIIEEGRWKIGAAHAIDYRLEVSRNNIKKAVPNIRFWQYGRNAKHNNPGCPLCFYPNIVH